MGRQQRPDRAGLNHDTIDGADSATAARRAVAAADRLGRLAVASPRLVHMPSRIFVRIGRYADAARDRASRMDGQQAFAAYRRSPPMLALPGLQRRDALLNGPLSASGTGMALVRHARPIGAQPAPVRADAAAAAIAKAQHHKPKGFDHMLREVAAADAGPVAGRRCAEPATLTGKHCSGTGIDRNGDGLHHRRY